MRPCHHSERRGPEAFSLLEMMMVLTLILLAAMIGEPLDQNMMLRRPAVMRGFFAEFTLSKIPRSFATLRMTSNGLRMTASGRGGMTGCRGGS